MATRWHSYGIGLTSVPRQLQSVALVASDILRCADNLRCRLDSPSKAEGGWVFPCAYVPTTSSHRRGFGFRPCRCSRNLALTRADIEPIFDRSCRFVDYRGVYLEVLGAGLEPVSE